MTQCITTMLQRAGFEQGYAEQLAEAIHGRWPGSKSLEYTQVLINLAKDDAIDKRRLSW